MNNSPAFPRVIIVIIARVRLKKTDTRRESEKPDHTELLINRWARISWSKKAGNIPPMDSLHEFSLIIRYNWNSSFLITSFQVKLSGRAPPLVIFLPRWKYFIIVRDRFFFFFFFENKRYNFYVGILQQEETYLCDFSFLLRISATRRRNTKTTE